MIVHNRKKEGVPWSLSLSLTWTCFLLFVSRNATIFADSGNSTGFSFLSPTRTKQRERAATQVRVSFHPVHDY